MEILEEWQLTQRTLVARKLALGACAIVWIPADAADIVVGHVPTPGGNGIPFSYCDLHSVVYCFLYKDSGHVNCAHRMDGAKQTRLVLVWQNDGGEEGGDSLSGSTWSLLLLHMAGMTADRACLTPPRSRSHSRQNVTRKLWRKGQQLISSC